MGIELERVGGVGDTLEHIEPELAVAAVAAAVVVAAIDYKQRHVERRRLQQLVDLHSHNCDREQRARHYSEEGQWVAAIEWLVGMVDHQQWQQREQPNMRSNLAVAEPVEGQLGVEDRLGVELPGIEPGMDSAACSSSSFRLQPIHLFSFSNSTSPLTHFCWHATQPPGINKQPIGIF